MKLYQEDLISTINSLCQIIRQRDECDNNKLKESYPYIPMDLDFIIKWLNSIKPRFRKRQPTFVDYGTGIGVIPYVANLMGFNAIGYEINKLYLENNYFFCPYINKGDLRDPNLFTNKQYDVVYFYCPFTDTDKEIEFELNAIETVKIGGYLICPYPGKIGSTIGYPRHYIGEIGKCDKLIEKSKNFKKVFNQPIIHSQSPIYKRIK